MDGFTSDDSRSHPENPFPLSICVPPEHRLDVQYGPRDRHGLSRFCLTDAAFGRPLGFPSELGTVVQFGFGEQGQVVTQTE